MRLLELEIQNVRGICHLSLKPGGNNFVVWGPNGSGKSAVVDAIDFLLTGRVSRLTGKGTGGITLSTHGPHIDHDPKEAIVRGVLLLPGMTEPVGIKRCMAQPNILECDASIMPHLEPILTLARRGQHVLTRREILKYITADAGTRAQEIQALLNITEIEAIRQTLVRVQNDFKKALQTAKRGVDTAKGAVNSTVQATTFEVDTVLQVVNQNRAILGGQPISVLRSTELKKELKPPIIIPDDRLVNITLIERDIANLHKVMLEQSQTKIAKSDKQLRALLTTIRSDPELLRALARQQLIELGITLIDETGSCPLCETPWPPGKLREYLKKRLSAAQTAAQHQKRISKLSSSIADPVNATIESIQRVIAATQTIAGLQDDIALLQSWVSDLQNFADSLSSAVEKYPVPGFPANRVRRILAPDNYVEALSRVDSAVKAKHPRVTPEQTAWDTLTRLEENLKALEKAESVFKHAQLSYQRASTLLDSFQAARDSVLRRLYDNIRDRFVELYRQLHGSDEDRFMAKLEPEGAGIDFEVDFYGRGTHPPHALHSEGHQDSMGLCLYLALAEQLTEGLIDLVILDDVMMSVDADHRRDLCRLLATSFPGRQFLITTHDKTWANQLKHEGIVTSRGTVEFFNWNIDTGPQVNCEVDMWSRIAEDLENNDVSSAAAKLRRGSEGFFGMLCDSLKAQVTYRLTGRWELGDFLPAAIGQYRKLIKQAKKAAQSWGDTGKFEMLNELDSTASQIFARCNAEQWAVNASVHYNAWANFSKKDFQPVVEAFQDLYGLFTCSKCGGMLRVATVGIKPVSVRCSCGKVDWNLLEEGKT
ncbi:MAG TPA: chromosome segregation protein SMC [Desulfobacterales bacterium]|nr:chromosome segregation protein SMC [Desulfobacterales bacterium]